MLERSHMLRQVSIDLDSIAFGTDMWHSQAINLFLQSADTLYGPITIIRRNGRIEKKIPWSAFALTEQDWDRVADARDILKDSNDIQELFSSEQQPTLWRALPAIEELQTAWEDKRKKPRFILYRDAISAGLAKLQKYYSRVDAKPVFILALGKFFFVYERFMLQYLFVVLHPYYKLDYIALSWGGAEEQEKERNRGNPFAKNWQDEARKVVERTVSAASQSGSLFSFEAINRWRRTINSDQEPSGLTPRSYHPRHSMGMGDA
jgi:hypothetical protein